MPKVKGTVDNAHAEAQQLRARLQDAAAQAQSLADALKAVAEAYRADEKQRIHDAITRLEDAAKRAGEITRTGKADLRAINRAMRDGFCTAKHGLGNTLASLHFKKTKL